MLRVAAVQYAFEPLKTFKDFARKITFLVKRSAKQGVQVLSLPEYLGYHLELLEEKGTLAQFLELFQQLAYQTKLFIQAGTILMQDNNRQINRGYIFFPNGLFDWQDKIMLTPGEKEAGLQSTTNHLKVFDSDFGAFAIAICYDIEFPFLVKDAVCRDAQLILVPSCTESLAGYYRVAICSRARAIENQCFVVHSCTIGKAGDWIDDSVGKAGIYCPCDNSFPPNGILSEGRFNRAATIFADLDFEKLLEVRENGSVRNYQDYTLKS